MTKAYDMSGDWQNGAGAIATLSRLSGTRLSRLKKLMVLRMTRESRHYAMMLALLLSRLGGLSGFRLASPVRPLLLRLVVGVRLLVTIAALPAEEMKNFLSVGTGSIYLT
jgi:hypothetical protein